MCFIGPRTEFETVIRRQTMEEDNELDRIQHHLNTGTHPDAFFADGTTPLYHATTNERVDFVQVLLNNKSNPNQGRRGHQNDAPLLWVIDITFTPQREGEADKYAIVQALLNYYANPNVTNHEGKTPHDLAVELNFNNIANLLRV